MLQTLRQTIHLVGRDHPGRWVILAFLALIASGFEMLGAVLVYVLLGLVVDPGTSIEIPVVGDPQLIFNDLPQDQLLLSMIIIMAAFFLARGFVHVGITYAQQRVAHNAGARLSTRLVQGYLEWPYADHLHRSSAELIRNAHQAVQHLVEQVLLPIIRISAETLLLLSFMVLLLAIAPGATLLAIVVVGGAAGLLALVVLPRLKRIGSTAHQMERDTLASLQQSLLGVRDIKLLDRETFFARQYGRSRNRLARVLYLRATANELPRTVIETALIGFILLFFGVTVLADPQSQDTLSVLGLFAYAGFRLQPSLQRIVAGMSNLKFAAAPIDDLDADLQAVEALPRPEQSTEALPFRRELALNSVSFRYPLEEGYALRDVNLIVRPGEHIAICGPTGGGKSTLVDIMTGLLAPSQGQVTIDGRDLQENVKGWQKNLGVVPQMVFLTDSSLRQNVALGVDDSSIDDDALHQAIDLAQLRSFVESLPRGLATVVGERGVRLSGGQRQRIAIARALYDQPGVLVFDEGTSALDQATEGLLLASLEKLRGERTVIFIAHRLSTVRSSDRVIFVEHGRITGHGTYSELRATHETFRDMSDP